MVCLILLASDRREKKIKMRLLINRQEDLVFRLNRIFDKETAYFVLISGYFVFLLCTGAFKFQLCAEDLNPMQQTSEDIATTQQPTNNINFSKAHARDTSKQTLNLYPLWLLHTYMKNSYATYATIITCFVVIISPIMKWMTNVMKYKLGFDNDSAKRDVFHVETSSENKAVSMQHSHQSPSTAQSEHCPHSILPSQDLTEQDKNMSLKNAES